MALIDCKFHSHALEMAASIQVVVPEPPPDADFSRVQPPRRYPCLYLLHGMSDDETIWQRRTSVERYVEGMPLVVVMPNAHRSFYTDMHAGHRYGTFMTAELPRLVEALFPVSDRRENRFVAGLSMGGYGAFRLALRHPEIYAAAASLSGALDAARLLRENGRPEFHDIFGNADAFSGSDNDLFALATGVARSRPVPHLFQWCGTEDWLLEDNRRFHEHAKSIGLEIAYRESPGGHEWACWDTQIQRVLSWLKSNSKALA